LLDGEHKKIYLLGIATIVDLIQKLTFQKNTGKLKGSSNALTQTSLLKTSKPRIAILN
jgi:hypothetical protein